MPRGTEGHSLCRRGGVRVLGKLGGNQLGHIDQQRDGRRFPGEGTYHRHVAVIA